jgi:hypothetical protein
MKCKFNEVVITFVDDDSRNFTRQKGILGIVEIEDNNVTVQYSSNNGKISSYIYPKTLIKEIAVDSRAGQEINDDAEYEEAEEYDVQEGAQYSERK